MRGIKNKEGASSVQRDIHLVIPDPALGAGNTAEIKTISHFMKLMFQWGR